MKTLLFSLFIFLMISSASSQAVISDLKRVGARKSTLHPDSAGWKRTGIFILTVNQSSQSYWGSGGEYFMIGINAILNKAIHNRSGKYSFDSYFDLELGVVEASSFKEFRKTSDRIDITFEIEHSIGKKKGHFNYGILGNLNTQLFPGFNYSNPDKPKLSSLFSPGKMLLSVGIDYKDINKNHYFSLFATPVTFRWITKIDNDFKNSKKFGVDSSKKVYTEIGAYLSMHYNYKVSKTLGIISRLDLFSNYKRKSKNVDLLLNNVINFSISRYFTASLIVDIVYDDDFKRRTQFQQITGLGLRLRL